MKLLIIWIYSAGLAQVTPYYVADHLLEEDTCTAVAASINRHYSFMNGNPKRKLMFVTCEPVT